MIEVDGLFVRESSPPSSKVQSSRSSGLPWHYRSVLEWWPEFDQREAEADAFAQFVRATGQPGLEVGCGSGQRLLGCRRAGLDVDGCEASRGLVALCRERGSDGSGVVPSLYSQALHELDLPRRYRSIYAGGQLGAGGGGERDLAGLRRLHRLLEPGGVLVLNHPAPWGRESRWSLWRRAARGGLEEPALPEHELAGMGGHGVLHLSSRVFEYRRSLPRLTYTVRAEHVVSGKTESVRSFAVCQRLYSAREVRALLCAAGFARQRIVPSFDEARQLHFWVAQKEEQPARRSSTEGPLGPVGQAGAICLRFGVGLV